MTALETMKEEMDRLLSAQALCVDEHGHVRSCYRYRYQLLVREAAQLKAAIMEFQRITGREA